MKKRTEEEKLQTVNEACELINVGIMKIRQAQKMLHSCGVEICDDIDVSEVEAWENNASNIQIFRGLPKLERIIGAEGYNPLDCITEKLDKSRKLIKYQGLVFLQVGSVGESHYVYK